MHPKQIDKIHKTKAWLAEHSMDNDDVLINGVSYRIQRPGNRLSILGFERDKMTYWLETPADVEPYWSVFNGNRYWGMCEYEELGDLTKFIEEKYAHVQKAELMQQVIDAEYRRSKWLAKIKDWVAYLKVCLWHGHNFTIAPTWMSAVVLCERCNKAKEL